MMTTTRLPHPTALIDPDVDFATGRIVVPEEQVIRDNEPLPELQPPQSVGEWTIHQIESALGRPLPERILKTKPVDGKQITYIPWAHCVWILSKYAPGWEWRVDQVVLGEHRLFLYGSLSIPTCDGVVTRQATGSELLRKVYRDEKTGAQYDDEIPYGDPSSNAEAMALKRAATKFKLGLYLYLDKY